MGLTACNPRFAINAVQTWHSSGPQLTSTLHVYWNKKGLRMTLIDFILKARLAGYPSGGEDQEMKFDDGSVGFEIISY